MPDSSWKRAERKGATAIGGVRTPLSGGSSRHTRADAIHPVIYLEMKYRKTFQVVEAIRKEEAKATKEGKVAVLGFQQRGLHTRYYLIPERLMAIILAHLPVAVKLKQTEDIGFYACYKEEYQKLEGRTPP